jgi:protein TonB
MIASSSSVKVLCLAAASFLVVAAIAVSGAPDPVTPDGGGQTLNAPRSGSSFADMSIGTLTAQAPQTLAAVVPSPPPLQPEATVAAIAPSAPPVVKPPVVSALPAQRPTTKAIAPALDTVVTAQDPSAAPRLSARPNLRDPALSAQAAAKPKGNAPRASTQGAERGTATARAPSGATPKPQNRQSGDAVARAYPSEVMRRISRVSKPRVSSRGTAIVAFSVSGTGGLSSLSISRSSGSAVLDQAALLVIRTAAPFPAPPRGAQRDFSINIKGR